jgi:hypothetical protein
MPLAVAAGLTHLKHDRPFQRDYWRRIIDFRRISGCWYAVIILYTPVKSGLAALIDILLGGEGIAPEVLARFAEQPLLIVPTIIFWLLFGPVPEEPGWRGYALDGLQARRNALSASLIVGVVWSLWHLPLFFIEGTWQAEQVGLGTQRRIRYDRLATMQRLCQNSISSSAFRSAAHGWNQVVTVGQTVQAVPGSRADLDQTATVRDEGPHLRRRARGACTCATGDL